MLTRISTLVALIVVVAALLEWVTPARAGQSAGLQAQAPPTDAEIQALLTKHLRPNTDTGIVVGIIGPAGRRVIMAGKAGPAGVPALDSRTVFEIGSATKVFTASLLMDMVRHGEAHLDDPIARYLPASVKVPSRGGREITLVDLATHTSGLPRIPTNLNVFANLANPYADYSPEMLYAFLSHYELPRDIGQQYEYSNLGVGLLGYALALHAGTSYEALVRTRILEPLQMRDTGVALSPDLRARLAVGHNAAGAPVPNWDFTALAACGAIRSTLDDMLRFVEANLAEDKPPLGPVFAATHVARHAAQAPDRIGLAWHMRPTADGTSEIVWHNGGTGGYHSFIGFNRKTGIGVVVLHNAAAAIEDIGFRVIGG